MPLHKTYTGHIRKIIRGPVSGFTILEVLMVIALMGSIALVTGLVSMSSYERTLARSDVVLITAVLRQARNLSMANSCLAINCTEAQDHGVRIEDTQIILFEGPSYASRTLGSEEIFSLGGTPITFSTDEIIFTAGSGDTPSLETITISNAYGSGWKIIVTLAGGILTAVET